MAVNMKLGVDLGSFNSGINQAKAQIRTFDAALKSAESQFKATGDAESAMTTKMSALSSKLAAQKKIVDDYRKALEAMTKNNVDPMSSAFQKMQKDMLLAESAMYDTQTALNGLTASEQAAAAGADQLTQSVNGIGKKMSLDQVIGGINKITDGLENAARKAVDLGEKLWNMIMDSAQRADDQATMAEMYNIPLQRYKQMLALEKNGLDTTTDAILSSQKKLSSNIGKGSTATLDTLRELGLLFETGKGAETFITTDQVEMFWEAGQAMMALGESFDKEAAAQSLFGRSWNELVPLFTKYKSLDEYEKALGEVNITSEETTENLADLSDKVGELQNTWTTLKDEIIGAVAPGLTTASEALNNMLSTILEYLKSENGQAMLNKLGESVAGLFDDLSKVNPEDVVNNFVTVFDKLTEGLEFLSNNWSDIVQGIKEIGIAFGLLKIGEGVLEGLRLINGFRTLTGAGGGDPTQTTGTKTGDLNSKIIGGMGEMVFVNWDPLKSLEYKREYGNWDGLAKYIDSVNGTNLYELQQEWEQNKTKNSGGNFWQQVMDSPKNLAKVVWDALTNKGTAGDWSGENGDDWSVKVKPEAEEESAEALAEQIGAVTVPVKLSVVGAGMGAIGGGGSGLDPLRQAFFGQLNGYANGIPFVPDTRLAWLHPGERVMTASENKSYTFNNHTYFGSVNLNNGTQVEQLADAIDRNNQKQARAYGA